MKLSPASSLSPIFTDYETWLSKQPLSVHTRRAYRTQVRQFCVYLDQADSDYGDPLKDEHAGTMLYVITNHI